jgi:hypothetical protein
MMILRYLVCSAALLTSVGTSAASAANWDPQGVAVTATQEGQGRLTMTTGGVPAGQMTCNNGDMSLVATGAVATASAATNSLVFGGCSFAGLPAHVTTFGDWAFTATSTTAVSATARPAVAGGVVARIVFTAVRCMATLGESTISNNVWSNTNHTLSIGTNEFALTVEPTDLGNEEQCTTGIGNAGRLDASYQLPSSVVITP